MYYDQKIRYLQLRNEEGKIGNAGFLRMECCENRWRILLQVSGLTKEQDGKVQAYLGGQGKAVAIGEVEIMDGRGRLELRGADAQNMMASGLRYEELEEAKIPLTRQWVIYGNLCEAGESARENAASEREVQENAKENASSGREMQENTKDNAATGKKAQENAVAKKEAQENTKDNAATGKEAQENAVAKKEAQENTQENTKENAKENAKDNAAPGKKAQENAVAKKEAQENAVAKKEARENTAVGKDAPEISWEAKQARKAAAIGENGSGSRMALKAGKWEQLDAIYPHIAPFGDGRRYLQISPGDFVILKEKSYRKVNNSFLLHGYFSYKHLILHRAMKKGEAVYYVGVPGHFFDKEKEVALLFGFESFEGGMEPAKEGDFGYYMMRVEL